MDNIFKFLKKKKEEKERTFSTKNLYVCELSKLISRTPIPNSRDRATTYHTERYIACYANGDSDKTYGDIFTGTKYMRNTYWVEEGDYFVSSSRPYISTKKIEKESKIIDYLNELNNELHNKNNTNDEEPTK